MGQLSQYNKQRLMTQINSKEFLSIGNITNLKENNITQTTIPFKSLRFFPSWNPYCPMQIIGFLNMITYILDRKKYIENWVELGSFIGESANIILGFSNIKHIDCVDISKALLTQTELRLKEFVTSKRCSLYHESSDSFLNRIPNNYMDVVYIDANHDYDFVKKDIDMSFQKLNINGFLCGHDYDLEKNSFPGCSKAIQEFSTKNKIDIVRFIDKSWLMIKK